MIRRWLLAAALGLGLGGPASATILFAGGEDVDFAFTSMVVDTAAGDFRSAWAREAIETTGGSTAVPPSSNGISPTFTSSSDIWVHGWLFPQTAATTLNTSAIGLASPDGIWRILLQGTGTSGQWKVSSRNAAGTLATLATSAAPVFSTTTLVQVDMHVVYGTSGSVNVYLNGSNTPVITFTGDNTTNGATQLNDLFVGGANGGNSYSWSEIIVADSDTRAMGLLTMQPIATGNAMNWTGATPCTTARLAQKTINDANFITSTANNDLAECTINPTIPAGVWRVPALVMSTRILRGTAGPQTFGFVTRTAGTDFVSGSFSPAASFGQFGNYIQALNPSGGGTSPWVPTDFTTAGFNIGLQALP